jgi:D-3-phosphoglycerate dehydrogenase
MADDEWQRTKPVRSVSYQRIIFDCDSTLVTIEGIDELARLKGQAEHIAALTQQAMDGRIPLEQVYAERLARLQPTRAELAEIGRLYRQNLVPEAAEVVAALKHAGAEVFIVSGGLLPAVRELAGLLDVPAANVRAVQVELDQLTGDWWDYHRHRLAGNPDERYLAFAPTPLAETNGKLAVVREIGAGKRTMLVGDGVTDLAAKGAVRLFVGFGGVVRREAVAEGAEVFVEGPGLAAILPLALSRSGAERLHGTEHEHVFRSGVAQIREGRVAFKDTPLQQHILQAHSLAEAPESRGHFAQSVYHTMNTYRILVTDDIGADGLALLRSTPDVRVDAHASLSREALLKCIGDYDAVITRSGTALDAEIFRAARRLKVAARAGVGLDNVDLDAATLAGVMVMNLPEANAVAAAEHALALMLALCRSVPQADARLRARVWERRPFMGVQLHGKTLGVVGLGRVGSLVAARARAFGMHVIAHDPYVPEENAETLRVELVEDLDDLLERADFVSLHAQLTDETRHLIGPAQIARMKPGARLVNTARGALIDDDALYEALSSGKMAGAALDVFSVEPPFGDERAARLLQLPNVVATPHLGASTVEAQADVSAQIAQQVLDALRGAGYRNVVNLPFAEGADYRAIAPYMTLAEKIGSLHMQLARGRTGPLAGLQVRVAFHGGELKEQVKPLTVALLKGLLAPILGDAVNYVNAPRLAHDRGIAVRQSVFPAAEDYANVIICRVIAAQEERLIAGTVFAHTQPRIVRMDDIPMDALPSGCALIVKSRDVPGVIGQVGTRLGAAGVNIAEYRLGRDARGGTALSFINLDAPAPEAVLVELRALPQVIEVRQVYL